MVGFSDTAAISTELHCGQGGNRAGRLSGGRRPNLTEARCKLW